MDNDAARRADEERLLELIAAALREADRLGFAKAAIDLDAALHKVRASPSGTRH